MERWRWCNDGELGKRGSWRESSDGATDWPVIEPSLLMARPINNTTAQHRELNCKIKPTGCNMKTAMAEL